MIENDSGKKDKMQVQDFEALGIRTFDQLAVEGIAPAEEHIREIKEGTRMGSWTYDPKVLVLRHDKADYYEVDLERMRTNAEIVDWLVQVGKKPWCSRTDLGDLLMLIDHLFDLQASMCSNGCERGPRDGQDLIDGTRRGLEGLRDAGLELQRKRT